MEASCSLSSLIQHRAEMQRRQPLEHGAWHAEEAISVQREDIMWLMYNSVSHGWRCTWLERRDSVRERDTHKEQSVISILHALHSEWKPHSRFYQSNCPPIHLNYTWMRIRTITALQNSKGFCHFDSASISLSVFTSSSASLSFISHLPQLVFTCQWLLCKYHPPPISYLHVSGFCCLMVLRWNESNLLGDSQAILPAITLIHSGQWILMTMKPGGCEEILQAFELVTLVWLSCGGSPATFTSKRFFFFFSNAGQHLSLVYCRSIRTLLSIVIIHSTVVCRCLVTTA